MVPVGTMMFSSVLPGTYLLSPQRDSPGCLPFSWCFRRAQEASAFYMGSTSLEIPVSTIRWCLGCKVLILHWTLQHFDWIHPLWEFFPDWYLMAAILLCFLLYLFKIPTEVIFRAFFDTVLKRGVSRYQGILSLDAFPEMSWVGWLFSEG